MKKYSSCRHLILSLSALLFGAWSSQADVFTLDTNQSSLTLSGSLVGVTMTQQGTGSLTTKYAGTIQAAQTAGTLQFTGASLITALNSGSWQPLPGGASGSAPANYGLKASQLFVLNILAAIRGLQFDVTSPALTVAGGQFDEGSVTFLIPTNATSTIDYTVTSIITNTAGTGPMVGNTTNIVSTNGILTTVGNLQTLTLKMNARFTYSFVSTNDTVVNVAGQLVGTRIIPPPPVAVAVQIAPVTNQVVALTWQSPAGQFFQVQSSPDLQTWQTNASNVTSATTNYSWLDTNAAPLEFYRVAN